MTGLVFEGVSKAFGPFHAVHPASFELQPGQFVCFLGPSGCGKTTLLRLVAGLEEPTTGLIRLDGVDITTMPTHQREVGMVFQSLALFPHLCVAENVGYGLRIQGASKESREKRANELLELVQLPHIAQRSISELSGGQRQRVAIARALALSPKLFLLDEPLSALDANLRKEMQVELRQLQRRLGVTTIMVTHDQSEAMTTADCVVVMSEGRIEQIGAPLDIYRNPANAFVAGFIGTNNLLQARTSDKGAVSVNGNELTIDTIPEDIEKNEEVLVSIRPEDTHLRDTSFTGSNLLPGKLSFIRDLGSEIEAFVDCAGQKVIVKWIPKDNPDINEGDEVQVEVPAGAIRVLRK